MKTIEIAIALPRLTDIQLVLKCLRVENHIFNVGHDIFWEELLMNQNYFRAYFRNVFIHMTDIEHFQCQTLYQVLRL